MWLQVPCVPLPPRHRQPQRKRSHEPPLHSWHPPHHPRMVLQPRRPPQRRRRRDVGRFGAGECTADFWASDEWQCKSAREPEPVASVLAATGAAAAAAAAAAFAACSGSGGGGGPRGGEACKRRHRGAREAIAAVSSVQLATAIVHNGCAPGARAVAGKCHGACGGCCECMCRYAGTTTFGWAR